MKLVRLWKPEGDRWVSAGILDGGHKRTVRTVAFSPDSKLVSLSSLSLTFLPKGEDSLKPFSCCCYYYYYY